MSECTFCQQPTEAPQARINALTVICETCQDKVRAKWQENIDKIGELFCNYRFETFNVNAGNIAAHTASVEFANRKELTEKDPSGLWITSKTPGNGKTHLGVSAVRQWLLVNKPPVSWPFEMFSRPWCITSDSKILQDVRKTYSDGATFDEEDVISGYARYPILMIDDLGKYRAASPDFAQRILFEIINIRYIQRKATIFTSNNTGEELKDYLGEYIFDRMRGMTRFWDKAQKKFIHPIYEVTGESAR
jgi:DNA replication protein DnaC